MTSLQLEVRPSMGGKEKNFFLNKLKKSAFILLRYCKRDLLPWEIFQTLRYLKFCKMVTATQLSWFELRTQTVFHFSSKYCGRPHATQKWSKSAEGNYRFKSKFRKSTILCSSRNNRNKTELSTVTLHYHSATLLHVQGSLLITVHIF